MDGEQRALGVGICWQRERSPQSHPVPDIAPAQRGPKRDFTCAVYLFAVLLSAFISTAPCSWDKWSPMHAGEHETLSTFPLHPQSRTLGFGCHISTDILSSIVLPFKCAVLASFARPVNQFGFLVRLRLEHGACVCVSYLMGITFVAFRFSCRDSGHRGP